MNRDDMIQLNVPRSIAGQAATRLRDLVPNVEQANRGTFEEGLRNLEGAGPHDSGERTETRTAR